MSAATDPRVDAYIEGLPEWRQAICREVRALVHAAGALTRRAARGRLLVRL